MMIDLYGINPTEIVYCVTVNVRHYRLPRPS